jgi:hypothetical protein
MSAHAEPAPLDEQLPRLFCVVAAERADVLVAPLREHFAGEPRVAVLVERRTSSGAKHPADAAGRARPRAPVAQRDPVRALPPELHLEARHLQLVQRMEPVRRSLEDTAMTELVERSLASEPEAVSELWWRVSPRVLARLRLRLGDFAAERATSHLLGRLLDELPGHDPERAPLTRWLDAVVDRYSEEHARRWRQPTGGDSLNGSVTSPFAEGALGEGVPVTADSHGMRQFRVG